MQFTMAEDAPMQSCTSAPNYSLTLRSGCKFDVVESLRGAATSVHTGVCTAENLLIFQEFPPCAGKRTGEFSPGGEHVN